MELWFVRVELVEWGRSICKMMLEELGYMMASRSCGYEGVVMCYLWRGRMEANMGGQIVGKTCGLNTLHVQCENKPNHVCYAFYPTIS